MRYKLFSFDLLDCTYCDAPVAPKSISAGPTVSYRCTCGTRWRINKDGDMTHHREPQPAAFTVNWREYGKDAKSSDSRKVLIERATIS